MYLTTFSSVSIVYSEHVCLILVIVRKLDQNFLSSWGVFRTPSMMECFSWGVFVKIIFWMVINFIRHHFVVVLVNLYIIDAIFFLSSEVALNCVLHISVSHYLWEIIRAFVNDLKLSDMLKIGSSKNDNNLYHRKYRLDMKIRKQNKEVESF